MSSITRATQQQQSSETTTKKKFGKNLNKLTKPPAPPIPSGAKATASSRNGLLLLSTKRASAGGSAAHSSGGILSNKPSQTASKPLPSLGLQYESNTSVNDALLGAVVGASRAESQQQPDAWGVADKKGQAEEVNLRPEDENFAQEVQSSHSPPPQNTGQERHDADNLSHEVPNSNWDEYGGRQLPGEKQDSDTDAQGFYMSQLARDRAEKRRIEEDTRQNEQKERAAQRLRELEQKMAPEISQNDASSQPEVDVRGHPADSKFVLEKLSRLQSMAEEHSTQLSSTPPTDRSGQRTLYDPNRTYTSLVGGGADKDSRSGPPGQQRNGRAASGSYSPEPPFNDSRDPYSRQPMIHLSSYEDRDRGERGTGTGPRMLFDPKSGSMVAVPSREDAAANARGRKDRGKKGKNARDKEAKTDSRLDPSDSSKGKKGKQRRDDISQPRGKDSSSPAKVIAKKGTVNSERKLPRTCGVLYAKDNKSNYFCVDGCDGDLGYGAHSVPGGRTRNPDSYAKFVDSQEQLQHDINMFDNHHLETSYDGDAPAVTLETGFTVPEPKEVKLAWVKPNEKIELVTGIDDSPTLQATAREWAPSQAVLAAAVAATGKERVALPTTSVDSVDEDDEDDDDDAPVSTWSSFNGAIISYLSHGYFLQFGLGFDPTLNMDSVMQSPSAEPTAGLDAVDLTALSLEPAMEGTAKNSHIFAFESGATWGSSNASGVHGATWGSNNANGGGSNAWGMSPSGNAFSNDNQNNSVMASTFLSLSSTNTWGGVPGLGGTTLNGSTLNREHNRSTGD